MPTAQILSGCEAGPADRPTGGAGSGEPGKGSGTTGMPSPTPGPFTTVTEAGAPVLQSQRARPTPFRRRLPVPRPIRPVRRSGSDDYYQLTAQPGRAAILDDVRTPIWGYQGTFPGPLFETEAGRTAHVHVVNELPAPIVRHLHGAHTPEASDGYPLDYILPRQAFDGHVHPGGTTHPGAFEYVYPLAQRAGLLWYHDHRMDFSGPQVWRGLIGLHVHRDPEERALNLPSGDHELPLLLCDRSFGAAGELLYPSTDPTLRHTAGVLDEFSNGVLGDTVLVNGVHAPFHEVRQGTYRIRIANASNARSYRIGVDPLPKHGESFVQIGTDGGLMAAPRIVRSLTLAPAERVDVVIDFGAYPKGAKVRLVNLHGGPGTTDLVQFRVTGADDRPRWQAPVVLSDVPALDPGLAVRTRRFSFSRMSTAAGSAFQISHHSFEAGAILADPQRGDVEIWELVSDLAHPVHLHNAHFQVLGDPGPTAWKDVVSLAPQQTARIITRFDSYPGRYVFHCHNLEHEDMGMMANYRIG